MFCLTWKKNQGTSFWPIDNGNNSDRAYVLIKTPCSDRDVKWKSSELNLFVVFQTSNPSVLETLEEWKRALVSKTADSRVEEVLSYMRTCAVKGQDIGTLRPLPAISPWGSACALWLMNNILKQHHQCLLNTDLGGFLSLSDCEVRYPT